VVKSDGLMKATYQKRRSVRVYGCQKHFDGSDTE
jgi:hypothetical protein